MRIDKFLKVSRIIKRRTVASEVAAAGRVLVNGKAVKPSYNVKIDDIIEVTFAGHPLKVKVITLDEPKGKDFARDMYEILE